MVKVELLVQCATRNVGKSSNRNWQQYHNVNCVKKVHFKKEKTEPKSENSKHVQMVMGENPTNVHYALL